MYLWILQLCHQTFLQNASAVLKCQHQHHQQNAKLYGRDQQKLQAEVSVQTFSPYFVSREGQTSYQEHK